MFRKPYFSCMEQLPPDMIPIREGYALLCAVLPVSQKGMTGVGEVDADLVGAAGNEMDFHQGAEVLPHSFHGDLLISCFHGPGAFFFMVQTANLIFSFIFNHPAFESTLFFCFAPNHGNVSLAHCPGANELTQLLQGSHGLSGQHNAAGVSVQPVADGGTEGRGDFIL